jgi:MYXO-CTERM domain-containing protein
MTGTGATATIQVTVNTAATSAHSSPVSPWKSGSLGGVALACLVFWRRRRREDWRMLLVLGAVCLGLTGCGLSVKGGDNGGPGGDGGSGGQGIYTITVGAGAPGVSHSVTLNLTVE